MSDETVPTPKDVAEQSKGEEDSKFTPPSSQAELDRIIGERVARERAKFSDYDELKSAASKLSEIQEADKTEIQKATERAEDAERQLQTTKAESLRLGVAARHGITGEYLDLLHGSDEESLEASAQKIASLIHKAPRGPIIPTQGDAPDGASPGTTADIFAAAVEGHLNP